jgi:hypothetical protein
MNLTFFKWLCFNLNVRTVVYRFPQSSHFSGKLNCILCRNKVTLSINYFIVLIDIQPLYMHIPDLFMILLRMPSNGDIVEPNKSWQNILPYIFINSEIDAFGLRDYFSSIFSSLRASIFESYDVLELHRIGYSYHLIILY